MKFKFREQNPDVNRRKDECKKVIEKYPDRIPLIIEKDPNCKLKEIDRTKFLVPDDIIVRNFGYILRKRLELSEK